MKQKLAQIFCTKLGLTGVICVLFIISAILTNWFEWAWDVLWFSTGALLFLWVVASVYAWILNPTKERRKND